MDPAERERQWSELMERSLQGDSRAYRQLLVLLTVAVRSAVRRRVQFAGVEGEDIVQEVLLALHLKRGTWVAGTPLAPWIAAVARNKIVDALRRQGLRAQVPLEDVIDTLWNDTTEGAEQAHDLEVALEHLNPRQREVVYGVSLEGRTAQEVAARLRMSEGAVRVTLHRSLRALAATFRTVPSED